MKKTILSIIFLVIVGILIWFIAKNGNSVTQPVTDTEINTQLTDQTKESEVENKDNTKPITNVDNKKIAKEMTSATLKTNKGDIIIEFFDTEAPKTVENFTKLAKAGFYDKTKFHRVIKGFMVQGGDPLTKDDSKIELWGRGDPGYKFADEINAQSDVYTKVGYKKGIVAMANSGPNTNGSQFFIMHEDYPLPPSYTIFAKVVSGQDVVDKIALSKTTTNDRPVDPVIITSISVN